jgi:hypothetical protein
MGIMDIPDPHQTTDIARAYLKRLRQHPGSNGEIQKPEVRAWLELEKRLMLEPEASKPKDAKAPAPRQSPATGTTPKKKHSIWKRPLSELWR